MDMGVGMDKGTNAAPVIRPVAAGDLAAVAEIHAGYVTGSVTTFEETPLTVAGWQHKLGELTGRGLPFLVAEAAGSGKQVVGYAYAAPWRPKPAYRHTAEVSIYLAPGWTGRGLGRELLAALLDHCEAAGVRQLIAVIAEPNDGASAALHRRFGFADAGRLTAVGHKHGRWLDTLLMQRALIGDQRINQATRPRP
jgi:L-amino acid N-acyltransferase YncA